MSATEPKRLAWRPIEPLLSEAAQTNGRFTALEALRTEWERQLSEISEEERTKRRQRTLRQLAVETGILERLYEIDWGLTLTLVAEGFAREVVERAGGAIDDATLATLNAQRDALEMVVDFVRAERKLSPGFVKELHHALTRTQSAYTAVDLLGRVTEAELPHGQWKLWANHVERSDGSVLEYSPPEHVSAEMDRLTSIYERMEESKEFHPIVRAAWLHHRFVQIHPFADGNGRVARALTLLVLQRNRYAPLVVDRFRRSDYIDALDAANDGELRDLVKLFVSLESAALVGELESWEAPVGTSVEIAHTLAAQLVARRATETAAIHRALTARANYVSGLIKHWFETKQSELQEIFQSQGLSAEVLVTVEMRGDSERTHYFRRQVIDSARRAGHFADLARFAGWTRLLVVVEGAALRYIASLHATGREPGVMAVTTFAVLGQAASSKATTSDGPTESTDVPTTFDAFRFVHTETLEALDRRSAELSELLDSGLSLALVELMRRL